MRLFTVLLALCQKVGAIDDYVVESGISGIWEYKKWHSGKKECTGRATNIGYGAGTAWMSGNWHLTEQITFPPGLFENSPQVNATTAGAVLAVICGSISAPEGVNFYILNEPQQSGDVDLNITAKGT